MTDPAAARHSDRRVDEHVTGRRAAMLDKQRDAVAGERTAQPEDHLANQSGRAEGIEISPWKEKLVELGGCEPYEEDTWEGRRLQLGTAVVKVLGPIPRCVVTTQKPEKGDKDFATLTAIARHRGRGRNGTLDFGVYGTVLEPGVARVGAPAELV